MTYGMRVLCDFVCIIMVRKIPTNLTHRFLPLLWAFYTERESKEMDEGRPLDLDLVVNVGQVSSIVRLHPVVFNIIKLSLAILG